MIITELLAGVAKTLVGVNAVGTCGVEGFRDVC